MKNHSNLFQQIISTENLFLSWEEVVKDKRKKKDVLEFEWNLEERILELHRDLKYHTYKHDVYTGFIITDPKQRHIHKAVVRDRIVHHAIYRVLYPIFDSAFIYDSYSCRLNKGTHKAVGRLKKFARKVSKNYNIPCFALKCDVKKFFDTIDHQILINILEDRINDSDTMWLIKRIISSFNKFESGQLSLFGDLSICGTQIERERERERERRCPSGTALVGRGIPIGNLTSQLFANVYLNELDQFVKHKLKIEYFLRYCDDFIILSNNKEYLEELIAPIESFLESKLKLKLHEHKVSIRKLRQGIDFLGYVVLPYHTVLRTKTKRRMFRKANSINITSYTGLLKHCDAYELKEQLLSQIKK